MPKLPPRLHRQNRLANDPRRLLEEMANEDLIATSLLFVFLAVLGSGLAIAVARILMAG